MNIDERIQALTINIESLHASTHELYEASQRHDSHIEQMREDAAQMRKDAEQARMDAEQARKDAEQARKDANARMAKLESYMATMIQSITRLSNVTAVHTIKIDDHEHRIANLESPRP